MAYMYILKCSDDSYYTGSTKNLEQRLWQHKNAQGANHTKVRLPVELVYSEYYERIAEAFAREKQIQKWSRKKKEALIKEDIDTLRCLSQSHFDKLSDLNETVPKPVEGKYVADTSTSSVTVVNNIIENTGAVAEPAEAK